jgi:hypothetical protein
MTVLPSPVAMRTSRLLHYTVRVRRSKRLRYRIVRLLLWAIPLLLVVAVYRAVRG